MEKIFESELAWNLTKFVAGLLTGLLFCALLSSCGPDRRIARTPSQREVRKAMQYSDWRYGVKPAKYVTQ